MQKNKNNKIMNTTEKKKNPGPLIIICFTLILSLVLTIQNHSKIFHFLKYFLEHVPRFIFNFFKIIGDNGYQTFIIVSLIGIVIGIIITYHTPIYNGAKIKIDKTNAWLDKQNLIYITITGFSDLSLLISSLAISLIIASFLLDSTFRSSKLSDLDASFHTFTSMGLISIFFYIIAICINIFSITQQNSDRREIVLKDFLPLRHFIVLFIIGTVLTTGGIHFGKGIFYSPYFFFLWFLITYIYWNTSILFKLKALTGFKKAVTSGLAILTAISSLILPILSYFHK